MAPVQRRCAVHHLRHSHTLISFQTREGVIMVTSLATFRSDLNIVLVPDGNFLDMREQLYVNINLLRMGCSGRTVLNLANPT